MGRRVGKDTGTDEMKGKWDLIKKSESRKRQSKADLKKQNNEIGSFELVAEYGIMYITLSLKHFPNLTSR